jgi:hypothetical protein
MISPKMWAYLGVGVGVLGLIAIIAWQMNSLMEKGVELGKAEATINDLRESLKETRDRKSEEIRVLKESNATCLEGLTEAERLGNEWHAKWDTIRRRPPRTVTVEIESTTWHESLIEGHQQFLGGLEGIRNADAPYPPG